MVSSRIMVDCMEHAVPSQLVDAKPAPDVPGAQIVLLAELDRFGNDAPRVAFQEIAHGKLLRHIVACDEVGLGRVP